jgi:integrase
MPRKTAQALTAAFCRSARPRVSKTLSGEREMQTDYQDAEVRGLSLRVSPGGQKSWSFRFRDRLTGVESRMTLGRFDPSADSTPDEDGESTLTLQGARVAARKLRIQVDADRNPARELRRKREAARRQPIKTAADLAESYFKACELGTHRSGKGRKKAPSTLNAERWLWNKHLAPRLGTEPLDEITRSLVRNTLTDIFEASGGQANKARALLSQMFNYAISQERLEANPVTHVARMSEANARTRTLTDGELKAFWGALQKSDHLVIRDKKAGEKVLVSRIVRIAIELALFTMQRRGEVSGIRLCELDLDRKTWLIPPERTKGRAEHLVPLSDHAVALIKEALKLQETRRKGASDFLFPSPYSDEEPIEAAAMSHAMADLSAALEFVDVRLHDLRRTGATGIAALGVAPHVVSKVLAHKDGGGGAAITARHYNLYAYAAEKRDALDRWAAHVRTVVGLAEPTKKPDTSRPGVKTQSVAAGGERLWTDLVSDDVLLRGGPVVPERLWTDLVDAA